MTRILFPTAYTAHSKTAFRFAQKLAQYFKASITLVHIYESPTLSLSSTGALASEEIKSFSEKKWEEEMEKLKSFADELSGKQYHSIELDYIATDGEVVPQLLDIQQENNFNLIVMGMRRHSVVDRLFGNTTYTLIDEFTCPLLLIPPDAHFMNIRKLLYGTAFKVGDQKTVEKLLDWCLVFGGTLDILHIHKKENATRAAENMKKLLNDFDKEHKAGVITIHLHEGPISKVLNQYIHSNGIDLMAIHRRKQGFLEEMTDGSLTKLLSEDLTVPLLVLKS